jgi:hypothetical protein
MTHSIEYIPFEKTANHFEGRHMLRSGTMISLHEMDGSGRCLPPIQERSRKSDYHGTYGSLESLSFKTQRSTHILGGEEC